MNNSTLNSNDLFDWSLYGALIRHQRQKMGYRNTADFSKTIYKRTRFNISKDVLYRIEQNRQEPTAMQFMAINLALFGYIWPSFACFGDDISSCLSPRWREFVENEEMPDAWKQENLLNELPNCGFKDDKGKESVFEGDLEDDIDVYLSSDKYLDDGDRYEIFTADREITGTVFAIDDGVQLCW